MRGSWGRTIRNLTPEDHARVWRIAVPMTLTGLATPMLGMVDTFVMGHLSAAYYLGAVAVGSTLIQLLFWSVGFLRMSSTALCAQAAHHAGRVRLVLMRGLITAMVLASFILLFKGPIEQFSYTLLALDQDVNEHSRLYFEIRLWGIPAVLINFVIWGWCLGMGNARAPLYLTLWINVLNMILDVVFVYTFGMKTEGVAYASLIADYSGLLLGGWILWRMLRRLPPAPWTGLWDPKYWWELFSVSHHLFVRTVLLLFAFAFFMAQGARMGTDILAANAVLINFLYITAYGLDGFAHGLEVLCGQAVGQRNRNLLERTIVVASLWCALVGGLFILLFVGAGNGIIHLLTSIPQVQQLASLYLPWLMVMPLFCLAPFLLDGLFIGTTRTREMRNSMMISILMYLLLWYLMQAWGNHGLWLSLLGFMLIRSVTLMYYSARIERAGGFVPNS